MAWKFSRSHQIAYHFCPYSCYLRYYADGKGYEPKRLNVELATGSLAHDMIAGVLRHVKEAGLIPSENDLSTYLEMALQKYKKETLARGFDIEDTDFELMRQGCLVEGMVRGWIKLRLPILLERFEIVSVEEEWEIPLDEDGEIVDMERIDSVWRDRITGDLWPLELKTTGMVDDNWLEKWRYDSQTLKHSWATSRKFPNENVGGVLLEVFYKGVKRKDEGRDIYYSPFLRAYVKRGIPPFDENEMNWDSETGRKKGWEVVNRWEWKESWDIPNEILAAQFFNIEIYRSDEEIEIWRRQTLLEQLLLRNAVNRDIEYFDEESDKFIMDMYFPKRLNAQCYSNQYRKKCSYLDVCFKGIDPKESDDFMVRIPHHAGEEEI